MRSFSPDTELAQRLATACRYAARYMQEAVAAAPEAAEEAGLKAAYWSPARGIYWVEAEDPLSVAKLASLKAAEVRALPEDWQFEPCVPVYLVEREKRAEGPFLRAVEKVFPRAAAVLLAGGLLKAGCSASDGQGWFKSGSSSGSFGSMGPLPRSFAVEPFVKTVLFDPQVAPLIDPAHRTAIVGLVETAAHGMDGKQRRIGVGDIAKTVVSMGVGRAVGGLVGGALGLLAGAPKDFQEKLKDTGMYAGVLTSILPAAFGVR